MRSLYIALRADDALQRALREIGYRLHLSRPVDALWELAAETFDVVIYDLAGGDLDHFAECGRAKPNACMLLAIQPDEDAEQRVALLRAGADACLSRPLSFVEVDAVLQAYFRRQLPRRGDVVASPTTSPSSADTPALVLSRRACKATFDGQVLPLSLREFGLLRLLAESHGAPRDRLSIWQQLGGDDAELSSDSIDRAVSRLRCKLAPTPVRIARVRKLGYQLNGPIAFK